MCWGVRHVFAGHQHSPQHAENLQGYIAKLEADLEQTRADLSHVVATLHLFEAPDDGSPFPMRQPGPLVQAAGDWRAILQSARGWY
jgi:hypothetical protein